MLIEDHQHVRPEASARRFSGNALHVVFFRDDRRDVAPERRQQFHHPSPTRVPAIHRLRVHLGIDIGDPTDLHPTNKADVGRRLAIAARHLIYGEAIAPSGPAVARVTRRGGDVVVSFRDVKGLKTPPCGSK